MSRWLRAAALLLAVAGLAGAGCGGASDDAEDAARQQRAYASQVSAISTQMERRLARLSGDADYRRAAAAAASTHEYAANIRQAATDLRAIDPPEVVQRQHAALVELYARTATSLDALADRFAAAPDAVALGTLAQELSSQVQRYASQEQQLRTAIGRALAGTTPPAR